MNTNLVDGNRIYCNLITFTYGIKWTDTNLKRSENNEDVGICLVVEERQKKPKLPKKRLSKILKKTGRSWNTLSNKIQSKLSLASIESFFDSANFNANTAKYAYRKSPYKKYEKADLKPV